MNVTRIPRFVSLAALGTALAVSASAALAQQPTTTQAAPAQPPAPRVARIVAEPASLTLIAGQSVPFKFTAYDSAGNVIENPPLRASAPRRLLRYSNGQLTGVKAGKYEIVLTSVGGTTPVRLAVPVTVQWPPIAQVEILPDPGRLYTGVTLGHRARTMRECDARVQAPRLGEDLHLRDRRPLHRDWNRQPRRRRSANRGQNDLVLARLQSGELAVRVTQHTAWTARAKRCVFNDVSRRIVRGDLERRALPRDEREARWLGDDACDPWRGWLRWRGLRGRRLLGQRR